MAFTIKVAIVLILVTLVPTARATSDDEVVLDLPAFETLNAAPVWTSRYLRSTESLNTTNEGNGEERVAKLGEVHADTKPLHMKGSETVLPKKISEMVNAVKKASKKLKEPKEIRKIIRRYYKALKKWWATTINSMLNKDDEVKLLVKDAEKGKDITSITEKLRNKHFQRWFNMERSGKDIHKLLELPVGDKLVESPLVWIWLEYTISIGRQSKDSLDTINVLEEMFGNKIAVLMMFKDADVVRDFKIKDDMVATRYDFLIHWLSTEPDFAQIKIGLIKAEVDEGLIQMYERIYNKRHLKPEAPKVSEVPGHGRV